MATTTTKKKPETLAVEGQEPVKATTESVKTRTTRVKINDDLLVKVKSVCFGKLYYRNKRSGEEIIWEREGEEQLMTVGELRVMKNEQLAFFSNQWIVITGIADGVDADIECADIYNALLITKYYENFIEPTDFDVVCSWTPTEIASHVALMSKDARQNLVVALNSFIRDGRLDSIRQIRAFEQVLGCELFQAE